MTAVYFIRAAETGHYKIGVSFDPPQRLRDLQRMCPLTLSLEATIPCGDPRGRKVQAQAVERGFHERYVPAHHLGEWFHGCPEIEADVASIRRGDFDLSALPTPTNASLFRPVSRHGRPRKAAA